MLYGCNENTKLPDGRHCPAYALAVRYTAKWWREKHGNGGDGGDGSSGDGNNGVNSGESSSGSSSGGDVPSSGFGKRPEREALLVIRGTTEIGDWSINMEEEPLPFEYLRRLVNLLPPPTSLHPALIYSFPLFFFTAADLYE